jgi:hypothetical protein
LFASGFALFTLFPLGAAGYALLHVEVLHTWKIIRIVGKSLTSIERRLQVTKYGTSPRGGVVMLVVVLLLAWWYRP